MTDRETWDFLMDGTRTAHVATVRADGRPHVKPVWFELEGQPGAFRLLFMTSGESVTGRALRRDARVAVSVDDQTPPYSFVLVQGSAQIETDTDELLAVATRLGGRYVSPEQAAEFGARNAGPGEYLVRVVPARVIAERDLAG
ncbi:MAG TPA: PPOX class F420-dependent oxidoreductase [Streptosporangiaceae bacterium]|nr:PPOX class F420-dependent oxidoreductase [Streptosporangiaceae bacterium]